MIGIVQNALIMTLRQRQVSVHNVILIIFLLRTEIVNVKKSWNVVFVATDLEKTLKHVMLEKMRIWGALTVKFKEDIFARTRKN